MMKSGEELYPDDPEAIDLMDKYIVDKSHSIPEIVRDEPSVSFQESQVLPSEDKVNQANVSGLNGDSNLKSQATSKSNSGSNPSQNNGSVHQKDRLIV